MSGTARVQCSAAPRWRDWHQATDLHYHVADLDGRQYTFCKRLLPAVLRLLPAAGRTRTALDRDTIGGNMSDELDLVETIASAAADAARARRGPTATVGANEPCVVSHRLGAIAPPPFRTCVFGR